MSAACPATLDVASLAALLQRAGEGSTELPGALAGQPLLAVDLDTPGELDGIEIPPLLPCVIVGVTRTRVRTGSGRGVDVALTEGERPALPWVSVADLDAALEALATAVDGSPQASVALVQVLRSGDKDSLDHDLLLESLAYSTLQGGPEFSRWLATAPTRAPSPQPDPVVALERTGDRLSLTLNRPKVRNAYNAAMRDALCEALSLVCADPSIREVHLFGGGPDFCSGGDLAEFGTSADPATAHLIRTSRSGARLLGMVGGRVVAHLHGACVGAGIELPALAGRVVADPGTRMRLPELAMGLIPGAGGTATLPRRIGRHRTAWMALSGQFIGATTGRAWGLIDEIVGT
jgi:enoyl-CoA hydratase/carnithine racemase